ncbi:OmpP1/FadL family transporter [Nitratifractor sp.]
MKKISIAAALALGMVSGAYATNGDTLIGVGAKTRSMGGAGIAFSHGAESTLVNPALITRVPDTEISFGGTVFMPDIHTKVGASEADSDADLSMIPAVALVSHLDNGFFIGAGMYGTAGMGTDFRGNPGLFDMETTLQLMQFVVPVAYKFNNGLSVGIAPILQYGSLDINYVLPPAFGGPRTVSDGQRQDFGFGVSAGLTYDFGNGLTIGAVYKSEIKMNYAKALTTATGSFSGLPGFPAIGDDLTQPAEYGIGIGYRNGPHGIAIDYKRIAWGSAAGYKDFGWKDQDVFSIGYQYDAGTWSARIGYNHASNPVKVYNSPLPGLAALDMFNLLGFPATMENHLTAGFTYRFSKQFSADLTAVYGFEKKTTADISALFGPGATIENKHSEFGVTVQLNYRF